MKNKHDVNIHLSEADEVVMEGLKKQGSSGFFLRFLVIVLLIFAGVLVYWLSTRPNTFLNDVALISSKTVDGFVHFVEGATSKIGFEEKRKIETYDVNAVVGPVISDSLSILERSVNQKIEGLDKRQLDEFDRLKKQVFDLKNQLVQVKEKQVSNWQDFLDWKNSQQASLSFIEDDVRFQVESNYQKYQNQSGKNVLMLLYDQVVFAINDYQYVVALRQANVLKAWLEIFPDLKKKYDGLLPAIDHDIELVKRLIDGLNWGHRGKVVRQLLDDYDLFKKSPDTSKKFLGGLITIRSLDDHQLDDISSNQWELRQLLNRLLWAIELEKVSSYREVTKSLFSFLRTHSIDSRYDSLLEVLKEPFFDQTQWLLPAMRF